MSIETWNAVFSNLPKKACRKAEFFSSHSPKKNWNRKDFFFKNFFVEVFPWTRRLHFWQPHRKKIDRKPNLFCSIWEKNLKNPRLFFKKFFRSNCFCKHAEGSFGSPAAIFLTKGRKLSAQCPEMIKKLDSSFWRPCWKTSDWMPKRFCSVCENDKMYLIFFKKTTRSEPTDRSKKNCTTLPKTFARRPKFFRSFLKTISTAKVFFQKLYFSSKVSCGHVGFSFDNFVGCGLTKNWKSSLNKRKWKKITFSFETFFLKRSPQNTSIET